MKRILTIVGVIALLLVFVLTGLGVWAYYKYMQVDPLTEAELAELSIDWDLVSGGNWSPWWDPGTGALEWNPAASFNAWIDAIPEEDKAWPILVEAYYDHHKGVYKEHAYMEYSSALPNHAERWSEWLKVIESDAFQELNAKVLDGCMRPYLGAKLLVGTEPYEAVYLKKYGFDEEYVEPVTNDVGLLDVHLSWLGHLRTHSTIVRSQAAYKLELGDTQARLSLIE